MKTIFGYIKYELLPEYTEKSQLTDLFTQNKFWGWLGLLTIFLSISSAIYFQLKLWDKQDILENKKINDWKEREFSSKK